MIKEIRALSRGIDVLRALNQKHVSSVVDLAAATGLSRATVHRMIQTLVESGIARRIPRSGLVSLTAAATELGSGYNDVTRAIELIEPLTETLTNEVHWPIDIHEISNGASIVRGSTTAVSPMCPFQTDPGTCLPILGSAGGRAIVATLSDADRELVISEATRRWECDARIAATPGAIDGMITNMRNRGYAFRVGGYEPQTFSIALPVRQNGKPIIAVSMIFFRRALTVDQAAQRYLSMLKEMIESVESELATLNRPGNDGGRLV
ncbi:hypothetical protein IP81_14855 [Novosphingobium sp. AAP83]|uniref:helix-turn-helix domain-containing protein n=1 Tax=Novosphingobium sp. AAP83 TaxID=1523425 RepID=UPI0006B910CC|nr:helix-turn-helix domain-containing protein [Novosphingobium sp. AAP83]KPF90627.1 hypothetical protein IP81_14855 [Novosphingobium sp. AAP83]